jgi:alkylation response protein AidB-like acyl-CoA dehydrogenase
VRVHEDGAQRDFRDRARSWLAENAPTERRPSDEGPSSRAFDLEWQRRQHEGGWAGIQWPTDVGGLGLTPDFELIWLEEYARARAPEVGSLFTALNHAGPTLFHRGTDEQKAFHIPAILEGRSIWCQGFSEPDAGSDLASLTTSAVRDGDALVVTGQKIWTSYASISDYGELLVRTSRGPKKHAGLTWVICDMSLPGIDVRPIRSICGTANHFAEVFYDEVRIPVEDVVGEIDDGWSVALATLSFERGTAFAREQLRLAEVVRDLVDLAALVPSTSRAGRAIDDGGVRQRLGRAVASTEALRAMTHQILARNTRRDTPGADGSIVKAYFATLSQEVHQLAFELRGADAVGRRVGAQVRDWNHEYLWSFQESIGGGTTEIQKNIIGERHLGLPR